MRGNGNHIYNNLGFAFISILFLLATDSVSAQSGKLLFHHLRLENGLSDLTNSWVYKDSKGFVWISSIRGLNRFDGTYVKNYFPVSGDSTSLNGENIQSSFYEDANADLWFCTYEAVHRYNRKSDNFESFVLKEKKDDVLGYHIFCLDGEGNLWINVEEKGLYTFNIHTKDFKEIIHIAKAPNRGVAIKNESGKVETILLYTHSGVGFTQLHFDEDQNLSESIHVLHGARQELLMPNKILLDKQDRLWIAGRNELVEYDLLNQKFIHTSFPGIISIGDLDSLNLLVSVDEEGIWEYDKNLKLRRHQYLPEFTNTSSLLSPKIDAIQLDRDGGCWIASWGIGLSYAYPEKRKFHIHSPLPKSDARSIKFNPVGFFEIDDNRILAPSPLGIFELNRNGDFISMWEADDENTINRINSVQSMYIDVRKNIWLSSYSGLSVFSPNNKRVSHITDAENEMFFGLQLMDGRLIFSRRHSGVFEVEYRNGKYEIRQLNPTLDREYMILGQDQRGTVWLSDKLQQLILLDPFALNPIDTVPIGGITRRLIHHPQTNTIWIAGSSGLHEVDDITYEIRETYDEGNLIPCAGLSNMLMDDKGILWLTCKNHIMSFNPQTKSVQVFGQEDGLPGSSFKEFGGYQFEDGEIWFGSVNSITKFYPANLRKIKTQAIPQITTLLINDNLPARTLFCRKSKARNITEIEKLSFSYKENTLTFIVNSLEYSAPAKNKIRYKMDGLDADWIETTNGSRIRYSNLPARALTFMVSAANSDGEYSSLVRKIEIDIKPPVWKRWWFITLAALSVIGLVFYIFYINFRRKLEVQTVRLKLYENLHDDVGSRLMAIVMSADTLLQADKENSKLQNMANISRSIVGNMRRLVWAIDPENESMNSLLQKIRHDKSQILDEKINFHLSAPPELMDKVVPGEVRYQVSSIINESMNNINKYAQAQNVWIIFSRTPGMLHVLIRDDGKGFNMEDTSNDKVQSTGYGMGNMQKRAARIKAKLAVNSQPGKGTSIEIKIPFS